MDDTDYYWIGYTHQGLLMNAGKTGIHALPLASSCRPPQTRARHNVGRINGKNLVALELDPEQKHSIQRTAVLAEIPLRQVFELLGAELYQYAGKGAELVHWNRHTRFCPGCGAKTTRHTDISKRCPACGYEMFPAISPAILALVHRGDTILLARARRFPHRMFSILAGFVETGETLEECVHREVMEESGLSLCNVRYFGSQPWPYPSGLMVGYTADYYAGEIDLRDHELCEADFYTRGQAQALPLPEPMSLARVMIDHWLHNA